MQQQEPHPNYAQIVLQEPRQEEEEQVGWIDSVFCLVCSLVTRCFRGKTQKKQKSLNKRLLSSVSDEQSYQETDFNLESNFELFLQEESDSVQIAQIEKKIEEEQKKEEIKWDVLDKSQSSEIQTNLIDLSNYRRSSHYTESSIKPPPTHKVLIKENSIILQLPSKKQYEFQLQQKAANLYQITFYVNKNQFYKLEDLSSPKRQILQLFREKKALGAAFRKEKGQEEIDQICKKAGIIWVKQEQESEPNSTQSQIGDTLSQQEEFKQIEDLQITNQTQEEQKIKEEIEENLNQQIIEQNINEQETQIVNPLISQDQLELEQDKIIIFQEKIIDTNQQQKDELQKENNNQHSLLFLELKNTTPLKENLLFETISQGQQLIQQQTKEIQKPNFAKYQQLYKEFVNK